MSSTAKWRERHIENVAEWGEMPIFRAYASDEDTIGTPIKTPPEMQPATFVKDPKGLAEHLKHCCYGPSEQLRLTANISYIDGDSREVSILTDVAKCRSKYYHAAKRFTYHKRDNSITWLDYDGWPILVELMHYEYHATFQHAQYGLCKLNHKMHMPVDDAFLTTTFSPVSDTLDQDVAQHVTLDELIDTEGLTAHNCCCIPRVSSILICKNLNIKNKEQWGGRTNLGKLKNFKIRYFLDYDKISPRPTCHDKYQKAFYIDMVYNPVTSSFDRQEVKFDIEKHKNVEIPLN